MLYGRTGGFKDHRFFMREGLRFELEDTDGELSMLGTVLSEDWGHLTDLEENADSAAAQALYEGQIAANLLGRAHFHYKEITFEKSVKPTNSFMTIPTA